MLLSCFTIPGTVIPDDVAQGGAEDVVPEHEDEDNPGSRHHRYHNYHRPYHPRCRGGHLSGSFDILSTCCVNGCMYTKMFAIYFFVTVCIIYLRKKCVVNDNIVY